HTSSSLWIYHFFSHSFVPSRFSHSSLHDALPICVLQEPAPASGIAGRRSGPCAALLRDAYLCCTALLATPPPADFTQTVVTVMLTLPRNRQVPSAALTAVVAMRAPGHVLPTAAPLWISTLGAKLPLP